MPQPPLPPLTKLDPAGAWQPWQPTAADPWNLQWAGHLYRRAGFGATPDELREAVAQGLPATLDRLIQGDPKETPDWESLLEATGDRPASYDNLQALRGWWLYAMLNTPRPLQEKMTLFWHNHFATSAVKVQRTRLMFRQNVLLRHHALGKFRPFLLDISRDPAMLVWLDSNNNVKGKPNENYARELMELFSLGVGHYTEKDIREAARAFTGWHTSNAKFDFESYQHDDGPKTVLGRTGNWNGDDIVRIVLDQPAAARFLVRKLYRAFISENADPPDALLEPLATAFRQSDYDIAALMRTMLSSRHFFSPYAYRQRIKSPVEFVVSTVRLLFRKEAEKSVVEPSSLIADLEAMGQELFAPPNVKGWPGGKTWLNSATVLARHNFAQKVASGHLPAGFDEPSALLALRAQIEDVAVPAAPEKDPPEPTPERDTAALADRAKAADPARVVDALVETILQGRISPAARAKLVAFVADGKPAGAALKRRLRDAVHAIMTVPEYQLA